MIDFKLSDDFVDSYRDKEVPWGYQDGAGNALGEITFLRTYSRKLEDGSKETWVDTCRRVIEGMFSIQKRHCRTNHIEWKNDKAQRTAKDAFDRLFNMKWLPSGRGLWAMGSDLVMEEGNSAPLQSCAFISTDDSIVDAMTFLFDASMLGVGVGFDADGAHKFDVTQPVNDGTFVIPDSREGWVESLRILLASYLDNGKTKLPEFDYSDIRPAGSPIKRFGGVASGSGPLKKMHTQIEAILANRVGEKATMTDIADIGNIIGTCVVSGNVRRCLPEGTKVHTTSGLVNIEDIKIGDTVEVAGKTAKVSNFFDQGVQETVIVKYDGGQIECTPNHRLAVFDTLTSWTFKRADELTTDDRLVWDRHGITGVSNNQMPAHNHVKRSSDTTGQDIVIPDLDTDSAWLIGLIHGDGYVFLPSGITPNGHVMIASAPDTPEVLAKAQEQLARYGVRVRIQPPREDDKAIRVYANSSQLAAYMHKNVKQANTSITIPDWIKTSAKEIRAAYLAGLMDADGSYKTRPLQAIVTIYPEFASQVVDLYTSLGIQARAKMCRPAIGNWKALYTVDIVGGHNIRAFEEMISQYSMKRGDDVRPSRSRGGATFSTSMVREAGIKGPHVFNPTANRQNAERVEKVLGITLPALPYQVLEVVPSGRSVQTYDIEVEDIHQFTANGLVVHNSAEIFFVDRDSDSLYEFLHLKDYDKNPERGAWGFMSNNSVRVSVGDDLTPLMDGIKLNGEPGVVWMDVTKNYGRLVDGPDGKDIRVRGFNPCSEQPLESSETCVLGEVFINNCDDQDDFIKTLKVAYLYGKTVTLMPTKWEKTNTVMQRNRRIGLSASGVADFVDAHGMAELRSVLDDGFNYVLKLDKKYSEWLCIRESIRHTTMKPSGSISILAGSSPGTHWTPGGEYFIRRITFAKSDPLFQQLLDSGYEHETLDHDPNSAVILFPIHSKSKRASSDVPAWEKIHLASEIQAWWSDNGVSCTVDFKPSEAEDIPTLLAMYDGKLKGISFLPAIEGGAYKHMPYEGISKEKFEEMRSSLQKAHFGVAYSDGKEAEGEKFCATDFCEIEEEISESEGEPKVEVPLLDLSSL